LIAGWSAVIDHGRLALVSNPAESDH